MAQLAPSAIRPARPIQPPRVSLLSSAILVDEQDDRWEAGFGYVPEGCGDAGIVEACDASAKTAANSCIASTAFTPFGIWASDKTSSFNFQHRDWAARATRKLLAVESKLIEAELYDRTLGTTAPKIRDSAAVAVVPGAPRSPVDSLAEIENVLATCSGGIRTMIHVRPGIIVEWMKFGVIRREGDVYLTPMDNIVVPGRGYSGASPGGVVPGATEWIYTTAVVEVRRSNILVFPSDIGQATNSATNDTVYWAERIVSAAFDPNCCRFALEVTRTGG